MATPGLESGDEFANGTHVELSEAEKEVIREELKKTEDEINTLRQVLVARQKHVAMLKRKLNISPLTEITEEFNQGLKSVKDSQAYQKTSEVVAGTADTVATKLGDIRNSSLFKSFESKLGSAFTSAKMAASTSIDQLAGAARGGPPSQAQTPQAEHATSPLS
uniref:Tumor protein D52 n=1 Tax=Panagrolaimus sp. ES5 TaxID=591445 RepID=A0AC34G0E3_9BILA